MTIRKKSIENSNNDLVSLTITSSLERGKQEK